MADARSREQAAAVLDVLADAADDGPRMHWNVAEDPSVFAWIGTTTPDDHPPGPSSPAPPAASTPSAPPGAPMSHATPASWPGLSGPAGPLLRGYASQPSFNGWPQLPLTAPPSRRVGSPAGFPVAVYPVAPPPPPPPPRRSPGTVLWDDDVLRRLASLDTLHRHHRVVREGSVFVCGMALIGGDTVRVCLPLLSRPVRLTWASDRFVMSAAGDVEVTRAIPPGRNRARLEDSLPVSPASLQRFVESATRAVGLFTATLTTDATSPLDVRPDSPMVIAGSGLYVDRSIVGLDLPATLRAWGAMDGIDATAFGAMYGIGHHASDPAVRPDVPVWSPFQLNVGQLAAVRSTRREPITVVSGPPGTGKSHTVVAAAIDAVDQGHSVLVATLTDHATEVLGELLHRRPGPTPVLFGNAEQRSHLATQLITLTDAGVSNTDIAAQARYAEGAANRVAQLHRRIGDTLEAEHLAAGWPSLDEDLTRMLRVCTALTDTTLDLEEARRLYATAGPEAPWHHRAARRAADDLRELVGADDAVTIEEIGYALRALESRRTRADLETSGGSRIDAVWDDLERAASELSLTIGALVSEKAQAEDRMRGSRRSVASLASALRGERGPRRRHLRQLDAGPILRALPLWVGTVRDIDDLLPSVAALFDLVILDEAAQLDQVRAAPALLRGRRALVVGDPHQLALEPAPSVDVNDGLLAARLPALPQLVDAGRDSVFDLASGATAPIELDEHYRSVAHLVSFPLDELHELGAPRPFLATRHPRNECLDAIETVTVEGSLDDDGVNTAEVEAVRLVVRDLDLDGARSVGVVSPVPAHAAALERMLLEEYDPHAIRRLGLRVGTVEALQGAERDIVVTSFGVGEGDDPSWFALVEDSHRFNVMITRARERVIVVTSLRPGNSGLARRYLAYAEHPLDPVPSVEPDVPWIRALRDEFERMGIPVRTGYPVGRWTVDLVIGTEGDAIAVECVPHPDGPAAHIARHCLLVDMGWRVIDAFPTRWEGDPVRGALSLVADITAETDR